MKIKFLIIFFISIFLIGCNSTNPKNVTKSDTQKITSIKYGYIISSMPVKIKGEGSVIGATTGGLIGGLLGTQICGEEEVLGTKCQDIAVVYGTIGGAALGYVTEAILGNHDGFQYIVNIDNNDKDSDFVQGDKNPMEIGQRVVIIYGSDIRVMPYEE